MEKTQPTPASSTSSSTVVSPPATVSTASSGIKPIPLIVALIAIAIVGLLVWQLPTLTGQVTATQTPIDTISPDAATPVVPAGVISANLLASIQDNETKKRVLSKAKYTAETYKINRAAYDLFEKAAAFKGMTLEEINAFFFECCDLTNEDDIFSNLPPIPSDFSTVAFDVATGSQLQIGQLESEYYKQPEFYFFVGETAGANRFIAFREWANPHLEDWGDYGVRTMPNQQWGNITKNKNDEAAAVVFVTAGWGIQNYQGVMWIVDGKSLEYFDVSVETESTGKPYHLISPTFPQFGRNWSDKLSIRAKAKPGTPAGVYNIAINPVSPPKEVGSKWAKEHRGTYAEIGFIRPAGNQIDLFVTVTE